MWIYGAATGIWRYGLNIQSARAAGAVALLPLICFVTWLVWFCLARAREALAAAGGAAGRRLRGGGARARGGAAAAGGFDGNAAAGPLRHAPDMLPR